MKKVIKQNMIVLWSRGALVLIKTNRARLSYLYSVKGELIYDNRTHEHKSTINVPTSQGYIQQNNIRNMLQGVSGSRHRLSLLRNPDLAVTSLAGRC